ncbi:MAG: cation:proton antiporter [Oscillospiraceae bacterium]|nr:cation:proton antiporter [Oscillospiraceae bacterium]
MEVLLSIAVALLAGLLMSRVVKPLKLPAVTGYLIAGLLIGPFALGAFGIDGIGFTGFDKVSALKPISDVALGFIAFAIGNEFRVKQLKTIGKQATVVAVFQALSATVLVDLGLLGLHLLMPDKINVADCITLGAIATATAPAATLMVVNQYKAKGPLVDILLPIVALDDAVGLVVFAVSFGIAKSLISGAGVSLVSVLLNPMLEVFASLLLGSVLGFIYTFLEKFFHSRSKRLCVAITFVIFAVSLSMLHIPFGDSEVAVGFSPLLVCMMMATVFCNICPSSEELMAKTDRWTAPLFVLFFVISGAELDLSVFTDWVAVLVGAAYILLRSTGKIFGASVSSKFTKCSPTIQKWLGITLLPQAGVALGMSLTVSTQLGPDGVVIRSIVLFSVLIYELVGPMLTKIALTKAGEISPKELNPPHPEQKRHRAKA